LPRRPASNFLFPIAKWRGFGGKTNYLGTSLETMTWASALLAQTSRIHVFSTVHVPIFHPLVAAKMGATIDHISNGRWGLNVVSGWSEHEFGMMGIEVLPHAERYQRTEAYIEILKGLLTSEPGTFDHESKWYRIRRLGKSAAGSAAPSADRQRRRFRGCQTHNRPAPRHGLHQSAFIRGDG
jgi:alkanesulfonate monooxygenase SsuD/methylene tetrahydromethanopterin reductase-like flavin-dependent oxidoreductase (luciferase family)